MPAGQVPEAIPLRSRGIHIRTVVCCSAITCRIAGIALCLICWRATASTADIGPEHRPRPYSHAQVLAL